jgi:hypothetical protein
MSATAESQSEKDWVTKRFLPFISEAISSLCKDQCRAVAKVGVELAYTYQIKHYDHTNGPVAAKESRYQTDVLVLDEMQDARGVHLWIPRVVIECKVRHVTTHDALTYSAKAATHKHVHPYLRYGLIVASFGEKSLPAKLVKHGANFDFIARWAGSEPSASERKVFVRVLGEELNASRNIQSLLEDKKLGMNISMFHRQLVLSNE